MVSEFSPSEASTSLTYAQEYDKIINWEKRLERELPLLLEFLKKPRVLDLACASGRHSMALAKQGFTTVGVDIEDGFIRLAHELCQKQGVSCQFFTYDLTNPDFPSFLEQQGIPAEFDSVILLGNALAEMPGLNAVHALMKNIRSVLLPGGRVIAQTINRPLTPHYVALRKLGNYVHQRIMYPVNHGVHNVELHINIIDPVTTKYVKQRVHPKFMLTLQEAHSVFTEHHFTVIEQFSTYAKDSVSDAPGKSAIWVLEYTP